MQAVPAERGSPSPRAADDEHVAAPATRKVCSSAPVGLAPDGAGGDLDADSYRPASDGSRWHSESRVPTLLASSYGLALRHASANANRRAPHGGHQNEAQAPGRSADRAGDRGGGDDRAAVSSSPTPPRRSRRRARSSPSATAGTTRTGRSASRSTSPRATRSSTASTAAPRSRSTARTCWSSASPTSSPRSST